MAMHQGKPGADTKPRPDEDFKALMWNRRRELAGLYPDHVAEARYKRLVVVATNAYRKLLNAQPQNADPIDPWSVMEATVAAAQLGLEAGSEQAYLVPYKTKVSLIIGPRGLVDIAYRSDRIASIEVETVRERDAFDYQLGDGAFIRHRKATRNPEAKIPANAPRKDLVAFVRGELLYAWAKIIVAGTSDIESRTIRKVMTAEDIEFHRSFSKASSGPWFDNEAAMWAKTVLKQAFKTAPRNAQLEIALQEDEHGHFAVPRTDAQSVKALEEGRTMSAREHLGDAPREEEPAPARTEAKPEATTAAAKPTGRKEKPATGGMTAEDEAEARRVDAGGEPRKREPGED